MKKILTIPILLTMIFAASTSVAVDCEGNPPLYQNWDYEDINGITFAFLEGKNIGQPNHLMFIQKDFEGNPIEDGNWGRLVFTSIGLFSFYAVLDDRASVTEEIAYTLIYAQEEPMPGAKLTIIGTGISNSEGFIFFNGEFPFETLLTDDGEFPCDKILLVLTFDIDLDNNCFENFDQSAYLFGTELTNY